MDGELEVFFAEEVAGNFGHVDDGILEKRHRVAGLEDLLSKLAEKDI